MTEQIANHNVLLLAEIANLSYEDGLSVPQTDMLARAGFTHIAPSTPNYNPFSYVDESGQQHTEQFFYGFNGQAFISDDRNTLVIGLRGYDSFADWVQHLSSGGVIDGSTQRRTRDIRAGDIVLSFDPATGEHLPRAVTKLYRGETEVWVNLTFTQNGVEKSLSTTPEHPFLTVDGQFAPILQPIGAGERRAA